MNENHTIRETAVRLALIAHAQGAVGSSPAEGVNKLLEAADRIASFIKEGKTDAK